MIIFRIMILGILLFNFLLSQSAKDKNILDKKLNIVFKDMVLKDVLDTLSKMTFVKFIYEDDLVKGIKISYKAENEELRDLLSKILKANGLEFLIVDSVTIAVGKARKQGQLTKVGEVKGIVKGEGGEVLPSANILIKETGTGCITDQNGEFRITLREGVYTFEVSYIGYKKKSLRVEVKGGSVTFVDCVLESGVFYIGTIEVVASGTEDVIPTEAVSKTYISGAEIEHFQATSLGDVLDLVPGVQKTENPGIAKTSQVAIRGFEIDKMSAFGTLVIVDGAPLSNNANLQFQKWVSGITGPSNLGGSIDLRTIPADNIESVEVIRGVPSVRFGDMTSGVIIVNTKTGYQPHRLKVKNNPDTKEANLGGAFRLGKQVLSYNLNLAQSERNIRLRGDEFTRLTGQIVLSRNLFNDRLVFNTKFYAQRIFDEEQPRGDVYMTRNYNRGYTLQYSIWGNYRFMEPIGSVDYNVYVTFRRENSMKSKLVQSDVRVLPSGDTVSSYIGKLETKGAEWTVGSRVEYNIMFSGFGLFHKMLAGVDVQYNANTGEGVILDTLFNYYGPESGKLPYKFDDIPGQILPSLYLEDKITGKILGMDFSLTLGFRYEMYRPYKFNIKGLWGDGDIIKSYNGTYFNPRGNLILYLTKNNQIRLSAGVSSKSPPMSSIYPEPTVIKWRDPVNNAIVYIRPQTRNPYLKGYREKQVEVGYDHRFLNMIGLSVSAYYKYRDNEPSAYTIPVFHYDSLNRKVYYIDKYGVNQNLGWSIGKGVEFSIKTARIKNLNIEFQVVGAYTFTKRSSRGFNYDPTPDASLGQYPNYKVPNVPIDTLIGFVYDRSIEWRDRFILNYFVKYMVRSLGLWITFRAENVVMERYRYYNLQPIDFSLPTVTEDTKKSREFEESVKKKPSKWLLSLNISQSIFRGAEISFYVNNLLDDPAIHRYQSNYKGDLAEEKRNPPLFYGIEISMTIDDFIKTIIKK